jgi:membrane-bound ClpP family serine protease
VKPKRIKGFEWFVVLLKYKALFCIAAENSGPKILEKLIIVSRIFGANLLCEYIYKYKKNVIKKFWDTVIFTALFFCVIINRNDYYLKITNKKQNKNNYCWPPSQF